MASTEGRQSFVNSTVEFLRTYDLDGIDVDWEYPEQEDRFAYTALLQVMKKYNLYRVPHGQPVCT
jgi:chitinase